LVTDRARDVFLVTCEHGGNRIPARYRPLFRGKGRLLATHRGYDLGALALAQSLARATRAALVTSTVSRLLVDLNRSPGHRQHFSEVTRGLPEAEQARIIKRHYTPYRTQVECTVERLVRAGRRVVHVAAHSFTPVLGGRVRRADVGLLYDPRRAGEVALCARWRSSLVSLTPSMRVRRNYPYRGRADGLAQHLRSRHPPGAYVGVELEVSQRIVVAGGRPWTALRAALAASLLAASRR
jgi:predicted N-formylglutamate amidohydrolase